MESRGDTIIYRWKCSMCSSSPNIKWKALLDTCSAAIPSEVFKQIMNMWHIVARKGKNTIKMFKNLWFSLSPSPTPFASFSFYVIASFASSTFCRINSPNGSTFFWCFPFSSLFFFLPGLDFVVAAKYYISFLYCSNFFLHFTYFLRILTTSKKYKSQICEKLSFLGSSQCVQLFFCSRLVLSCVCVCFALDVCLYTWKTHF